MNIGPQEKAVKNGNYALPIRHVRSLDGVRMEWRSAVKFWNNITEKGPSPSFYPANMNRR